MVDDVSKTLAPPKSSLKRRTLIRLFPPWKGEPALSGGFPATRRLAWVSSDLDTTVDFENILLKRNVFKRAKRLENILYPLLFLILN